MSHHFVLSVNSIEVLIPLKLLVFLCVHEAILIIIRYTESTSAKTVYNWRSIL